MQISSSTSIIHSMWALAYGWSQNYFVLELGKIIPNQQIHHHPSEVVSEFSKPITNS